MNYNGYSVCDISITNIHGRQGLGIAQLLLSISFQCIPWKSGISSIREFQAVVKAGIGNGIFFLGRAVSEQPFQILPEDATRQSIFILDIPHGQLDALEAARLGNDFRLILTMNAVGNGSSGYIPMQTEVAFTANISKWATVLTELDGPDHLVVGIPIPRCSANSPYVPAIGRLKRAREALTAGRYDTVVSECRMAIESAAQIGGFFDDMKEVGKLFKANKEGMTKDQRELLVYECARNYAHLAHHDKGIPEYFSRDDAHMLLGITVATISSALSRGCSPNRGAL